MEWQKAAASAESNCVAVAKKDSVIYLRNTKQSYTLYLQNVTFRYFLESLKRGDVDHLSV